MNGINKEIEAIKAEYPNDEPSYWSYLLAFRIFHAVNPSINTDSITDYKEFNTLLGAINDIKDLTI